MPRIRHRRLWYSLCADRRDYRLGREPAVSPRLSYLSAQQASETHGIDPVTSHQMGNQVRVVKEAAHGLMRQIQPAAHDTECRHQQARAIGCETGATHVLSRRRTVADGCRCPAISPIVSAPFSFGSWRKTRLA